MATTFTIRTSKKSGDTSIIARVQRPEHGIDLRIATGLKADIEKWNNAKASIRARDNYRRDNKALFDKMDEIEKALDDASREGALSGDQAKEIILGIVNREVREQQAKEKEEKARIEAEAKRVTFMQYFRRFVKDMENGDAVSNRSTEYANQSRKNYTSTLHKLEKYERARKIALDWSDIDMMFFKDFDKYLRDQGAKQNTISKHFRVIKTIVHRAHDEGLTDNTIFTNTRFRVSETEAENVYLTLDELDAIKAVDLSGQSAGHEWARDIFLLGCWCGQRISDYNNIKPENIRTERKKVIVEGENGQEDRIEVVERVFIDITQKKTGVKVSIPANAEIRRILAKYDNNLPSLQDQVFNRYIKDVCRLAGINDIVTITSVKGGKKVTEQHKKWECCTSHTARRTFCTLAFLSGMEAMDICKCSGHQSEKMLRKYIKADELETARKLADKYDFFK